MTETKVCAVIPAAGLGSRLGMEIPKILVSVDGRRTIWDILRDKLLPYVDRIHIVLSPQGYALFESLLPNDPARDRISLSLQENPLGMGDAIFSAKEFWLESESIFIVWGDQIHLSAETIDKVLTIHRHQSCRRFTLPLVEVNNPYVQYVFNQDNRLDQIRQTREGDLTDKHGYSDVGAFAISVDGLVNTWEDYLLKRVKGAQTGEINFLPFIEFLSRVYHWHFQTVFVKDPLECRGINTPADLEFFRKLYTKL